MFFSFIIIYYKSKASDEESKVGSIHAIGTAHVRFEDHKSQDAKVPFLFESAHFCISF